MNRASLLSDRYDLIVVGGGITGAGVFRLACASGLRCLLIEQRDFAWGTSSRSGKLVHGGLRYIAQLQLKTSFHSVAEREKLLAAYPGLVDPLEMMVAPPNASRFLKMGVGTLLAVYDRMSGTKRRKHFDRDAFLSVLPGWRNADIGGYSFVDGTTDDARLVLRVMDEGRALGGATLNYVAADRILRGRDGKVVGLEVRDETSGETHEVRAKAVISATGAWADDLRVSMGHGRRIRRLRGSHLVFSQERFPLGRAAGLICPIDRRNMYVLPWEGRVLLGTTDLDHDGDMAQEPVITPQEQEYLLATINYWFPEAKLDDGDVIATMAGVRPVVDTGKAEPSKESREEIVWADDGLVTISGGKLTTFALMARKALDAARPWLGDIREPQGAVEMERVQLDEDPKLARRLEGRHGRNAGQVLEEARRDGFERIADTPFLWAELRHAARNEQVVHLEDLMLRRIRVGVLLRDGGTSLLARVREQAQGLLGWDDAYWGEEVARYERVWAAAYGPNAARG